MSIASEITSIGENLKKDYQAIANLGADLTNVDKNIENIAELLDGVYDNLPKTEYQEGVEINLGKTSKGKLDYDNGVVGIGQTEQESTQGYNLFTINTTQVKIGANASQIGTKTRITSTEAGQWKGVVFVLGDISQHVGERVKLDTKISVNGQNQSFMSLAMCDSTGNDRSQIANIVNVTGQQNIYGTIPQISDDKKYLCVSLDSNSVGTGVVGSYIDYDKICVYLGNTDKDYEPYTGGQASPNPSYPQTINSVTGNQDVVIRGKNLFNKDNVNVLNAYFTTNAPTITSADSNRTIYLPCKPSTNYCVRKIDSNVFNFGCTREVPTIRNTSIQCKC